MGGSVFRRGGFFLKMIFDAKNKVCKKGFTLVEMAVVIGLLGLVLTLLANVLLHNYSSLRNEDRNIENRHNAKVAGDFIAKKLIEARDVDTRDGGGSITLKLSGSSIVYGDPYTNYVIADVRDDVRDEPPNVSVWFDKAEGTINDLDGNVRAKDILEVTIEEDDVYIKIEVKAGDSYRYEVYRKVLSK